MVPRLLADERTSVELAGGSTLAGREQALALGGEMSCDSSLLAPPAVGSRVLAREIGRRSEALLRFGSRSTMPSRRTIVAALLFSASGGCSHAPTPIRVEDWIRVGVDLEREAAAEITTLEDAGYRRVTRIDGDGFVAVDFVRSRDAHRAVRVVTRLGVAVALDSHETDGVRLRHGAVRLLHPDVPHDDVDGDGKPEVVVARAGPDGDCIAVVHVDDEGRVTEAPIDAEAVSPGSCASALEDVDGDGVMEAIIVLRWPELALDPERVPTVRVALAARDGGWPPEAMPIAYERARHEARRAALDVARRTRDVAEVSRLGVELAALANLRGATPSAQVAAYDEALAGLVLQPAERDAVEGVRAAIAAGWSAPER